MQGWLGGFAKLDSRIEFLLICLNLELMKEIAWSGQNIIFKVSSSFSRERPRNTWNEVTSKKESHQGFN